MIDGLMDHANEIAANDREGIWYFPLCCSTRLVHCGVLIGSRWRYSVVNNLAAVATIRIGALLLVVLIASRGGSGNGSVFGPS